MRHVVSISPDGSVSGLQAKPGAGFDLRKLGPALIERASEIVWHPPGQSWRVQVVRGPRAGYMLTCLDFLDAHGHFDGTGPALGGHKDLRSLECFGQPMSFTEYDDAVRAEIKVLDHWRLMHGSAALS